MNQQQQTLNDLLIEAVRSRDLARAQLYVQKGADPNCRAHNIPVIAKSSATSRSLYHLSGPVLHLAGCVGQFNGGESGFSEAMTDFLISAGARIDDRNEHGNTMLMVAVKASSPPMVRYWLSRGADPLAADADGRMVITQAHGLDKGDTLRQNILNALLAKMPDARPETAAPAAPAAAAQEIEIMKPPSVVRRAGGKPRGGGFTL